MAQFYDGTKLLSMKDLDGMTPEIFMCTTNRTGGKTVYFSRLCVNRYKRGMGKFMITYRFNYELDDCALTLLYGCRTSDEILFKSELDSLSEKNEKINVIYVLSHSDEEGYEKGFVGADIIKKYAPEGNYSIFVCGPGGLYKFLETELPKLEKERKYIRFEVFSSGRKVDEESKEFNITVVNHGNESVIKANSNETVLCALERAAIVVPARCHTGECGFCRSKLIKGKVYIPEGEDKRRIADMQFNFIHPCCCYPESDLIIRIN